MSEDRGEKKRRRDIPILVHWIIHRILFIKSDDQKTRYKALSKFL